jgi:flavin-dependent dehydrogenase
MDLPSRCDVIVIGGGPAGSTAPSLLSQRGNDVGAESRLVRVLG